MRAGSELSDYGDDSPVIFAGRLPHLDDVSMSETFHVGSAASVQDADHES